VFETFLLKAYYQPGVALPFSPCAIIGDKPDIVIDRAVLSPETALDKTIGKSQKFDQTTALFGG